jgi:hypothetical protein
MLLRDATRGVPTRLFEAMPPTAVIPVVRARGRFAGITAAIAALEADAEVGANVGGECVQAG